MALMSSGRLGDQVSLTSVLHEFKEGVCITVDYYLQDTKSGASSSLSAYLLSEHRFPIRLYLDEWPILAGNWKRGCIFVPRGTYRIMSVSYTHLTLPTNREV